MKYYSLKEKQPYWAAIQLMRTIPELKNVNIDDLTSYLYKTKLTFFERKQSETVGLIRLTLPFAFLIMVILIILSPIKFMITGNWYYKLNFMDNWFRMLKL